MATGGSIQEVSIRSRTFSVAADADSNRRIGGYQNGVEPNGDRSARVIKSVTNWLISGLSLVIDDNRGDQEFLQSIVEGEEADADGFYSITVTYASGVTWQGRGTIIEEVAAASQNATTSISLSGPGKLTRQ